MKGSYRATNHRSREPDQALRQRRGAARRQLFRRMKARSSACSGPNGAGKTSTVEILEGLRTPDSGRVSVCGLDPQTSGVEYKYMIGAALQSTALPDKLRVHEALDLFGSFYPRRAAPMNCSSDLAWRKSATRSTPTFRRAEAAAGAGHGAGERSARRISGRADRGPRSAGAARNLRHY